MKEIRVRAEQYALIVIDDTPAETSYGVFSHTRSKYANVSYWGTSNTKILSLEIEPRHEIVDNAKINVINDIVPTWCNGKTRWGHTDEVVNVDLYKDSVYDTDLDIRKIFINEQAIELNDGKFIIKDYKKYGSGLLIISEKPTVTFSKSTANLGGTELEEIKGRFFTTKKGSKAFDTTSENPTHILYKDRWGGCFNSYKGRKLPDGIYNHRASSNGGGVGYDYAVYELGNITRPSIEDF